MAGAARGARRLDLMRDQLGSVGDGAIGDLGDGSPLLLRSSASLSEGRLHRVSTVVGLKHYVGGIFLARP